jgi:TPR repeat protein
VRTSLRMKFAGAIAVAAILLIGGTASPQNSNSADQQCSLAVVSRAPGNQVKVCDSSIVQEMARKGHVFEQNQMGIASVLAISPDYNVKEAVSWFQRAAQRGYAPAQVNLAVMYSNGWGTRVDYGAALRWLHAAADQGFARAYYNLGILHLEGQGVRRDYDEAFRWFQKGADAGDSSAQTNVGYMYDQGLGCPRSPSTAALWYRKAANAGNPLGENNLADLYLRGEGVAQDDAEAFRLFQKAASQGLTGARIKLGYMYAAGRGTQRDQQTAYAWVSAASLAGDPRGNDLLHSLQKVLSPEQLVRAQEQAERLRSEHPPQLSANAFAP